MQILMVDDHVMFLQGMRTLLGVLAPEHQVDVAADLATALQLVRLTEHGLVLLDWHLADADGEAALPRLREAGCTARIVVLSGEHRHSLVERSIALGAAGFIPKTYSSQMLLAALQHVLAGRLYLPADTVRPTTGGAGIDAHADPRLAHLTPRQVEVYRAATRGLPNKLIARQLGIAEATVKTHLTAVYAALGVKSRSEAAWQAARDGIRVD